MLPMMQVLNTQGFEGPQAHLRFRVCWVGHWNLIGIMLIIDWSDGANFLDNEIFNLESKLPEAVQSARLEKKQATRMSNNLQVSYGLSVIAANVAYTLSTVWGKDKANFTFVDWGTVVANTGFSWGYGGLYLVDGQLDSPDPGCGVQVLYNITIQYYYTIKAYASFRTSMQLRTALPWPVSTTPSPVWPPSSQAPVPALSDRLCWRETMLSGQLWAVFRIKDRLAPSWINWRLHTSQDWTSHKLL